MTATLDIGGEQVWLADAQGPLIDGERQVIDLIGDALAGGASMLAIPVERLHADFFQLRTGIAGAIAQKVINYRLRLAIVGDIAAPLAASSALRDWVRESSQRRSEVRFLSSLDELAAVH